MNIFDTDYKIENHNQRMLVVVPDRLLGVRNTMSIVLATDSEWIFNDIVFGDTICLEELMWNRNDRAKIPDEGGFYIWEGTTLYAADHPDDGAEAVYIGEFRKIDGSEFDAYMSHALPLMQQYSDKQGAGRVATNEVF